MALFVREIALLFREMIIIIPLFKEISVVSFGSTFYITYLPLSKEFKK